MCSAFTDCSATKKYQTIRKKENKTLSSKERKGRHKNKKTSPSGILKPSPTSKIASVVKFSRVNCAACPVFHPSKYFKSSLILTVSTTKLTLPLPGDQVFCLTTSSEDYLELRGSFALGVRTFKKNGTSQQSKTPVCGPLMSSFVSAEPVRKVWYSEYGIRLSTLYQLYLECETNITGNKYKRFFTYNSRCMLQEIISPVRSNNCVYLNHDAII